MDRRSFLRTAGATASVATLSGSVIPPVADATPETHARLLQLSVDRNRTNIASTLAPWAPAAGQWNVHTAGHLYRRAGMSASMTELNAALAKTPAATIDALMDDALTRAPKLPAPPAHSELWLTVPPYTYGSNAQQQQTDYYYAVFALRRHWAALMTQPEVMLRERMVYFWANHFVVEQQKVYYPQMLHSYLEYFRKNPWGNFKQMVKDVTILPAMLLYLDGTASQRTAPNENYARELMELFTLGVTDKDGNSNYSDVDIHEVAKALTGYGIDYTAPGPDVLPAKYNVSNHDSSFKSPFADAGAPKKPYGLASSGKVSDDIIDALFQYKADKLAYFICGKLYQFFVYHDITGDVEKGIIAQMAQTFKNANWELKPVIAELLKSEHFFDEANIGAAIKSPYEHMLGLTRQLDVPLDELMAGTLWVYGSTMEQSLLDPPNVKGWTGYRSWISTTTLPIRNYLVALPLTYNGMIAANGATGYGENHTAITWSDAAVLRWGAQFAGFRDDINTYIDSIANFLCAMKPSAALQKSAVRDKLQFPDYEWAGFPDAQRITTTRGIAAAISNLPEFQLL